MTWRDRAACRDIPDFTEADVPQQKRICKQCPVTAECLSYALRLERDDRPAIQGKADGWPCYGGLSVRERLLLLKRAAA